MNDLISTLNSLRLQETIDLTLSSDDGSDHSLNIRSVDTCTLTSSALASLDEDTIPSNKSLDNLLLSIDSTDPLFLMDNIPITCTLLIHLCDPSSWLNDESINAYLSLLSRRFPQTLFLNTHFYSSLVRGGYKRVKGWTRKHDRGVFAFDRVLVPVNIGNRHWTVASMTLKGQKEIVYYDSMGSSIKGKVGKVLIKYLEHEFIDKIVKRGVDQAEWTLDLIQTVSIRAGKGPQQSDASSCGVYVCMTVKRLAQEKELDWRQRDADAFRKKMAWDLLLPLRLD